MTDQASLEEGENPEGYKETKQGQPTAGQKREERKLCWNTAELRPQVQNCSSLSGSRRVLIGGTRGLPQASLSYLVTSGAVVGCTCFMMV